MKVTYKLYNSDLNMPIDQKDSDEYPTVFLASDGRVGFIDTVGLFHPVDSWQIKSIKIIEEDDE